MAQNITIAGAAFSAVPAIEVPKTGGGIATFADPSGTTATASDVAQGKLFLSAAGVLTTGTASGGGGGSSYTLIGSAEYTVSTTTTSITTVGTIQCGSQAWTKDKILYIRVRDKAGARAGYFYGNDAFLYNSNAANGASSSSNVGTRICVRRTTSDTWGASVANGSTTSYGVFGHSVNTSGNVTIVSRYSSSSSLTINGTYVCDVYLLEWPDNVSIFA